MKAKQEKWLMHKYKGKNVSNVKSEIASEFLRYRHVCDNRGEPFEGMGLPELRVQMDLQCVCMLNAELKVNKLLKNFRERHSLYVQDAHKDLLNLHLKLKSKAAVGKTLIDVAVHNIKEDLKWNYELHKSKTNAHTRMQANQRMLVDLRNLQKMVDWWAGDDRASYNVPLSLDLMLPNADTKDPVDVSSPVAGGSKRTKRVKQSNAAAEAAAAAAAAAAATAPAAAAAAKKGPKARSRKHAKKAPQRVSNRKTKAQVEADRAAAAAAAAQPNMAPQQPPADIHEVPPNPEVPLQSPAPSSAYGFNTPATVNVEELAARLSEIQLPALQLQLEQQKDLLSDCLAKLHDTTEALSAAEANAARYQALHEQAEKHAIEWRQMANMYAQRP
jgi:hypothetical protein